MPLYGHDFPFGFQEVPESSRLRAVKEAGFGAVMIHWQSEGGKDACRRYDDVIRAGLEISTAHFPQEQMASFWMDNEAGDALEKRLLQAVREAGERKIAHMVVHTTRRDITPEPNETGLRRFARAVEAGEKHGVRIALENTRFLRYNRYLFDRIASPYLAFCFDCGHANCFTPGEDPLAMFGARLVTTHLHDNDGSRDQHKLIGEGSTDMDRVFRRLGALGAKEYNLESRYAPEPGERGWQMEEYLSGAYARLRAYAARAQIDSRAGNGVENMDQADKEEKR